jgi:pimeloyl-ACP methyl ester carboxylesterase
MTPAEIRAVGKLGGHAFAGLVSRIEQVHRAVGGRAFASAGPVSAPARLIHDSVTRGVYLAVRSAGPAVGVVGGEATSLLGAGGHSWGRKPAAGLALAVLNAVAGDQLGPDLAPLAIRMAVRADGRDVDLTAHDVADTFPHAARRIAVFVHGLAETEDSWRRRASQSTPYGSCLEAEFGYTPVYIRYNTGLHVSDNGRDLAALLEGLLAAWPEQVDEILLAGHSMGGLVIRSACHYGRRACAAWVERVRHAFYLGSPHLGAPLARAAGYAGWALAQVAETRPFATLVTGSSSIRDLRYGYVLEDDWSGCDQDCCLHDHRCDAPLLAGANHYAISATVTTDPQNPFGAVVGDLLVQPASGQGRRGRRQHIPFPVELGARLGGMHHFDLLNHPSVWAAMRSLIDQPRSS